MNVSLQRIIYICLYSVSVSQIYDLITSYQVRAWRKLAQRSPVKFTIPLLDVYDIPLGIDKCNGMQRTWRFILTHIKASYAKLPELGLPKGLYHWEGINIRA